MSNPCRFRHRPFALSAALLISCGSAAVGQPTDLGADVLEQCTLEDCDTGDEFGRTLATGDFNNDGFADLAVGVPGEAIGGDDGAGAVHVFYGSPGGLRLDNDTVFSQATTGMYETADAGDRFGAALAVGDLSCDGIDDLAIGVPFENYEGVTDAGLVNILYGRDGATMSGTISGFEDTPCFETGDRFGASLAIGHTDDFLYLAVGAPGRTVLFSDDAGAVNFRLRDVGTCAIRGTGPCFGYNQNTVRFVGDIADDAESFDNFGAALATGDFDLDGQDDLAIGVPGEDIDSAGDAGALHVLYAHDDGNELFRLDNDDFWHQNVTGISGTAEADDNFGATLVSGHFDLGGGADLAIGVPEEDAGDLQKAGAVQVIYSAGTTGLATTGTDFLEEADLGAGQSESFEFFGAALAAGDLDDDGRDDLAIGVPEEGYTGASNGGRVRALFGSSDTGVSTSGFLSFNQDNPSGMPDFVEADDQLGRAVAIGDFDGNGAADLAIGTPFEDLLAGQTNEGQVTVLYSFDRTLGAFGTLQFKGLTTTVAESVGSVSVTITRTGGAVLSTLVDYTRSGGTATPGEDFVFQAGTATWSAGDLSFETFDVTIVDDPTDEPTQTITFSLSDPSTGTAIGSNDQFTIFISDNDLSGQIFLDGFESGNTNAWSDTGP